MRKPLVFGVLLFAMSFAADALAQQSWVTEVKTGKPGPSFAGICQKLERLYQTANWKEENARKLAIGLAKELLGTFKVPPALREQAQPCMRETKYYVYFEQGPSVMEVLVEVLNGVGGKPQDVGTTAAAMRTTLLKDVKASLADVRQGFKEGRGSRTDYYEPRIRDVIGSALRNWGFTPQELGLSQEETKLAQTLESGR